MRPPISGPLLITQLFGGNPVAERYVNSDGQQVLGHDGVDIAAGIGSWVYPAWNGVVDVIDDGTHGFGLHAIVTDAKGRRALYGHLSQVLVSDGTEVVVHTPFARSGSTGNSTGPHVHWGIYPSRDDNGYGGATDPLPNLDHDVWPLLDLHLTNL